MDDADTFTRKVRDFIGVHKLISPGDSLVAAVSGGPDSMALLKVLHELRGESPGQISFRLSVAHFNHGLRAGADEEEQFVTDVCRRLNLDCVSRRADTRAFSGTAKLSIEEAGRELRHGFLRETACASGHNKIALGHTMDDQAETVLMRLIRGAGARGLSAMQPLSEGIVLRPLLSSTREAVLRFLKARGVAYVEDASNIDPAFLRNRVRHELLAILKDRYNPRIVETLGSHACLLGEVEDYLRSVGTEAYRKCVLAEGSGRIELELAALVSYHSCVQSYVMREAFFRVRGSLRDLGFLHVGSLMKLARSGQSGDSVDLPSGVCAMLEGNRMVLGERARLRADDSALPGFCVELEVEGRAWVPELSVEVETKALKREEIDNVSLDNERKEVFFDLDELRPPIVLRSLRPGDRIKPFGMSGSKKVHDVLVDMKVARSARRKLAALCDSRELLWLLGLRRSSVAAVTESTKSVLKVRVLSDVRR